MSNRLSNSAVDKYVECSLCYKLHYIDNIRPVRTKSALLFGGALDLGLNELLASGNLETAKDIFFEQWKKADDGLTDFSKSDLDEELIAHFWKNSEPIPANTSWRSLLFKGMLFLEQYKKEVLPKIKKVIAVQEPVSLKNDDGDEITGFLDMVVEWEDGKTYLLDNKSSSVTYEPDSAKTGQQLPLYYYIVKEKYKLDGVGYVVLNKKINKNKVKKCKDCGKVNTGAHKKCSNITNIPHNTRCNGEFDITIAPSVDIQYVFNTIAASDEQRVMDKFDEVNYNISNGYFATEHNEKKNKYFQFCPYKEYTPENPNFVKVKKGKKKK